MNGRTRGVLAALSVFLAKQRRPFRSERPSQVPLLASQYGRGEPSLDGLAFGVLLPQGNEALTQQRRR